MNASGENALEAIIGELLKQREYRLAVAESCTGGLIGDRITNVPGSSAYYAGSVTAYSYDIKKLILHVRRETLDRYGAVSEQTAREMAQGVRRSFYADVGLAVTGIAGPGGGTLEKPVGLVYVALAAPDGEWVEQYVWRGNRRENKERSAEAALDLLHRYLEARLSYS
jgi:PncC family amidohydrolase